MLVVSVQIKDSGLTFRDVDGGTSLFLAVKAFFENLWARAQQTPVEEDIRRRRWRWLGHTLRKPPSSTGRQALNWNPQGHRKRGRPRNTWRGKLKKNIKRTGQTWKQLEKIAQDRGDWRAIVGGLCSGKSKGPK